MACEKESKHTHWNKDDALNIALCFLFKNILLECNSQHRHRHHGTHPTQVLTDKEVNDGDDELQKFLSTSHGSPGQQLQVVY